MKQITGNPHAAAVRFLLCVVVFIVAVFGVMAMQGFWPTVGYVAGGKILILVLWPSQADGDALLNYTKENE